MTSSPSPSHCTLPAPLLQFEGKAGYGDTPLFEPITLCLYPQKWHCLLGRSGCGKSSLMRFIAGIEKQLWVQGGIKWSPAFTTPPKIAFMAQKDGLLDHKNIKENIVLGAALRGEAIDHKRCDDLIGQVGLGDFAHLKPPQLSGGMRQRCALARSLYEDSDLILLDEPFSQLDAYTRIEMQKLAVTLLKGKTILHITHDPREAALMADYLYILKTEKLHNLPCPHTSPLRNFEDNAVLLIEKNIMAMLKKS